MQLSPAWIIIFLLLSVCAKAQLNENFDDGNFTNNPTWSGDANSFEVINGQLHSIDSVVNSVFYLSTPSTVAGNAQWEFYINFKQSTSGANYMDVFLISDKPDVNNASNGFLIRIGGTPDEISLYRNDAGTATKIIDGVDGRSQIGADNKIKVKVIRDASNLWTLTDSIVGASPVELTEGTITDGAYQACSYFGISVKQSTSSFFGKHYFDNIYAGSIITDTVAPLLSTISVINQNAIDVFFSEPLEINSAQSISNYAVNNSIGNPTLAIKDGSNAALVHLTFANIFADGLQNTLTINNVSDVAGNLIATNTTGNFTWHATIGALPQDIIFTEIMADPPSGTNLPPHEYVEIYNRSNKTIDLLNWSLTDATGSHQAFPSITMQQGDYAVICDNAYTSAFAAFGKVVAVNSMPALNNDGDLLTVYDASNTIIDQVNYDKTYYHDASKENGGWSIEKIDANFPCATSDNWKASINTDGGTPATINSVNGALTDTVHPYVTKVIVVNSTTITVSFSELMDANTLSIASAYTISNGIGQPQSAVVQSGNQAVELTVTNPLQPETVYTLTVDNSITDCSGNVIETNSIFEFGIPDTAFQSDVLINEILFNPFAGGYDFVELYNRSEKIIDLSKLTISELDATTGLPMGMPVSLSTDGYYLMPKHYVAVTARRDDLISRYYSPAPDAIINVSSFPDYNNDENVCVIANEIGTEVDRFRYSEKFHYPLLNTVEGFSLERISFNRITQDSANWHSAAEALKATPGYRNSQNDEGTSNENAVTIEPEIFSPDEDGYNDVLHVKLNFSEPGLTANVQVYDNRGRLVQYLLRNQLIGNSTEISWDGINLDNLKANIGLYILYTEVFTTGGDVKKYKNVFVLAGKVK